jgi:muconolactone delta-isomerase
MKKIAVITTKITANHPNVDFEALKQKEIPMVMKWKQEGIVENFFIRVDTNGAMLIFQGLTMEEVVKNIESLPFFSYLEKVDYIDFNKIF